jgi:hypothetical protein
MPESMKSDVTEQLNRICLGYARRHRLNDDDRQEVFDHLEDAVEGYLTGQTRVTPDDALLIARARLGDVKGIVAQLRPEQTDNARKLARVGVAIGTGFLTVIVLPLAMLLFDPPTGSSTEVLRALMLLTLCFLLTEAGVFLTARVDMKSRWQRGVSLALVLPAILIFCLMLISTQVRILPTTTGSVIGAALLRLLAIACLAGHGILAWMLMTPPKREPATAVQ